MRDPHNPSYRLFQLNKSEVYNLVYSKPYLSDYIPCSLASIAPVFWHIHINIGLVCFLMRVYIRSSNVLQIRKLLQPISSDHELYSVFSCISTECLYFLDKLHNKTAKCDDLHYMIFFFRSRSRQAHYLYIHKQMFCKRPQTAVFTISTLNRNDLSMHDNVKSQDQFLEHRLTEVTTQNI